LRLKRYVTPNNIFKFVLIVLGACALAGLSFVYTITQYNKSQIIGSGKATEIAFIPSDFIEPMAIVMLSLTLSLLISFIIYDGKFGPSFYAPIFMNLLTLVILGVAYFYPALLGIVEYTDSYFFWASTQVFIIMLFILPIGFVGAVVGTLIADRFDE